MDVAAAAANALQTRVLAMTLTDVRASVAASTAHASPLQPADVILELSAAAQQLLDKPSS